MAKLVLRIFGGLAMIAGALILALPLDRRGLDLSTYLITFLPIGAGFLAVGAPLVGFAQVIDLLERIERHSAATARAAAERMQTPRP